jgi:acyl carrier protein
MRDKMPNSLKTEAILAWLRRMANSTHEITAETELLETGVLDSIAILELVAFVEEKFSFVLPLDEFVPENFSTVATIAVMIERLQSEPERRAKA